VIDDPDGDRGELKLQLRGHIEPAKTPGATGHDTEEDADDASPVAQHLYDTLRGQDNLVFANSRRMVELLTDQLSRRSELARVPNEFCAHHGSLSRDLREDAEARLKDPARPTTAICTSTLEMGIDIGSVDSIAQVGAPATVSGLRQRLGRSGRRSGQAAVLRAYITERELEPGTPLADELRVELVQTIAMVELLLEAWYETPNGCALHLSTLIQQILSLIAQHGGVLPKDAYAALCGHGPFRQVDAETFLHLLRNLGDAKLIIQDSSGLLLHGEVGERVVNQYRFYAAFQTDEEYRLIADGRPIGAMPVIKPITDGDFLIFAGRRWRVLSVDTSRKVIELTRARGGRAPSFTGDRPTVANRVRQRMHEVYQSSEIPPYLNATAVQLLGEGRTAFAQRLLDIQPIIGTSSHSSVFPWCGDTTMATLALTLTNAGLEATADGVALYVAASPATVWCLIRELADGPEVDGLELAALVKNKERDKFDHYLDDELLTRSYAAAALDVASARIALRELAAGPPPTEIDAATNQDSEPLSAMQDDQATEAILSRCGYAVIDVETTGLAVNHGDRIVEIAIVNVSQNGDIEDRWTTLLNPDHDPGPTRIHGLTSADLAGAPRFADITGDIAERIGGRIIVAHNALFDMAFLHAECQRAGTPLPPWPTLCTLEIAYQLRPEGGRRLVDCCADDNITLIDAHTALGDATATAQLLACYLREGRATGITIGRLGCRPFVPPPEWSLPASGRTALRSGPPIATNTSVGLTTRLAVARTGSPADDAYLDALDRALADQRLTEEEMNALTDIATTYGLRRDRVAELHVIYLAELSATIDMTVVALLAADLDQVLL
jgi:ATP-dependent Lhr-like helicase